jgi:uncharacterized RDD family membrane protein YckC
VSAGARSNHPVTPEAVAISLDVAGLGTRGIAGVIDLLIQGVVASAVVATIVNTLRTESTAGALLLSVTLFFVLWGYYPLFEGLWNGRTPGKRLQRLRVVRTDGQPVTWAPVLVRNLIRIIDWLPGYYVAGAVLILLTKRSQRLGDLAAGTIVVRERPFAAPRPLDLGPGAYSAGGTLDTSALSEGDYDLIRSFLERRAKLRPSARAALAAQVAEAVRRRVPVPPGVPFGDEAYVEAVASSYRQRFKSAGAPARPDSAPDPRPGSP